jgi:predicted nucleic acid-binding protein
MKMPRRILTLDSNVFIAALKADEPFSEECAQTIGKIADLFLLSEPSIVYQEVCGTLARRVGVSVADAAKEQLDAIIHPRLLVNCDKAFCTSAYSLCAEYDIYAIDALYVKVAIDNDAILISLDKKDLIDKVNAKKPPIEVYHVSEFPY